MTEPQRNPTGALNEVPLRLRAQWKGFVASRAPVLRWVIGPDEWDWVESFLRGPLDGRSAVFTAECPFNAADGYGFAVAQALLAPLTNARLGAARPWSCPRLQRGGHDVEVLAGILASFADGLNGAAVEHVGIVLAPALVENDRAWTAWVAALALATARRSGVVRIVLLDDTDHLRYDQLARQLGPAVQSVRAELEISSRITRDSEAATDTHAIDGQLRVLCVRTMQLVNDRDIDAAHRVADAVESLAASSGKHGAVVPARFSLAGGYVALGRHTDAVRAYRAAELASERAEASGDPNGLWLRVISRFGVAAGLLAAPHGAPQAAQYYDATGPMCRALANVPLELDAYRCAALAHELSKAYKDAWNANVKALGLVDQLSASERENATLVPLVDAMLRITQHRELRSYRDALANELRRRGLHGST